MRMNEIHPVKDDVFTEVLKDGFFVGEGIERSSYLGGSFSRKRNPLKDDFDVPIFYMMKVHEDNPVEITISDSGYVNLWPAEDKYGGRLPGQVYGDSEAYDLAALAIAPYDIETFHYDVEALQDRGVIFKSLKGFFPYLPENFQKGSASAVYFDKFVMGNGKMQDYDHVSADKVISSLGSWISGNENGVDSEKGDVEGAWALKGSKSLVRKLAPVLEERFKTKLKLD